MIALRLAVALLLLTVSTASAEPLAISQYVKKGITPKPANAPKAQPKPGLPAAGRRFGHTGVLPAAGVPPQNFHSPPSVDQIKYAPAQSQNSCFERKQCQAVLDIAATVVQQIASTFDHDDEATTTAPRAVFATRTQTGNSSTSATSIAIGRIPPADLEIANQMARLGVGEQYMALLTSSQQHMFAGSPVCFFANVMRMYESAASTSSTRSALADTTTRANFSTTTARSHVGGQEITKLCFGNVCASQHTTSTLPSAELEALATPYFGSKLPEYLESIYAPSTRRSGETAMTTCNGFQGTQTFTVRYLRDATMIVPVPTAAPIVSGASTVENMFGGLGMLAILTHVTANLW